LTALQRLEIPSPELRNETEWNARRDWHRSTVSAGGSEVRNGTLESVRSDGLSQYVVGFVPLSGSAASPAHSQFFLTMRT
jgi:hypothetical protein